LRRNFISTCLATSAAFTLAAVAGISGSASASASAGYTGKPVTLTYWNGFTGPDGPTVVALVNKFNATHRDIKIKMTIMSWDVLYEKLLPALASGSGPNIVGMDTEELPQYAAKHVFAPLKNYYADPSNDTKALSKGAVSGTVVEGTEYAVPINYAPLMLYWNKTLFAKAHISGPPKNWTQWQADAVKLSHKGSSPQYGISLAEDNTIPMWPILIWENGGGIVNSSLNKGMLSSPGTLGAVTQWSKLIIKDGIAPVNITGAEADSLFTAQKSAMEMNGPWATSGYAGAHVNFGLAPIPAGPKKTVTLADVIAMSANAHDTSAQLQASETFFTWWNTKPTQIYYAVHTGFVPTRADVTAADLKANPYVAQFDRVAGMGRPYELGTQYTPNREQRGQPLPSK
jgi:multiple sugar transport system substrate-binding protein